MNYSHLLVNRCGLGIPEPFINTQGWEQKAALLSYQTRRLLEKDSLQDFCTRTEALPALPWQEFYHPWQGWRLSHQDAVLPQLLILDDSQTVAPWELALAELWAYAGGMVLFFKAPPTEVTKMPKVMAALESLLAALPRPPEAVVVRGLAPVCHYVRQPLGKAALVAPSCGDCLNHLSSSDSLIDLYHHYRWSPYHNLSHHQPYPTTLVLDEPETGDVYRWYRRLQLLRRFSDDCRHRYLRGRDFTYSQAGVFLMRQSGFNPHPDQLLLPF